MKKNQLKKVSGGKMNKQIVVPEIEAPIAPVNYNHVSPNPQKKSKK